MKRLLAYLFIVLGLGLVFSVNSWAPIKFVAKYSYDKDFLCFQNLNGTIFVGTSKGGWVTTTDNIENLCDYFIYKEHHPKIYSRLKKFEKYSTIDRKVPIADAYIRDLNKKKYSKVLHKKTLLKHTQIAKAEPSQNNSIANEIQYCLEEGSSFSGIITLKKKFISFCTTLAKGGNTGLYLDILKHMKPNPSGTNASHFIGTNALKKLIAENEKTQIAKKEPSQADTIKPNILIASTVTFKDPEYILKGKVTDKGGSEKLYLFLQKGEGKKRLIKLNNGRFEINRFSIDNEELKLIAIDEYRNETTKVVKVIIAMAEPSQTQEVAETTIGKKFVDIKFCKSEKYITNPELVELSGKKCRGYYSFKSSYIKYKSDRSANFKSFCYRKQGEPSLFWWVASCAKLGPEWVNLIYTGSGDKFFYVSEETQIAKTETTIIPEDKPVEVAETTQEEFKPEDKDIDIDAPLIEIAEAITVDSQTYTLKGKVKDKSRLYLTIDGRPIKVNKNGEFEFEGFAIDPEEGEVLKIVAIDRWKNRSEKDVKINVDLKATTVARTYEKLKPYTVRVDKNNNKIAIIIGIEKYQTLENRDAPYANRDANAFRAYATNALGVKSSNIKLLVDSNASRPKIFKALKLWLPKIAGESTDIYIFFAGHGLASENGEDLYILPQDGDASLLEDTAITRVEIIKLLQKVNPKSVTMFFDTCYSGQTREERMLVASLRPIRIVAEEQDTPNNFTIFTASNYDQTSGSIEEAKHGMFSYYLMKGLEGKADNNKDKEITNGELIAYLKTNVSKEAFTQNREQDPMLSGDPDQVLMSYR